MSDTMQTLVNFVFFQLTERILEAHASVSNLDGTEAKLHYLKTWQALPEFGITTFVVKFKDSNKREVKNKRSFFSSYHICQSLGITWYCFKSSFTYDYDR